MLAGIRAGGALLDRLPARLFKACSGCDGEEGIPEGIRPLTVAGAAQAEGYSMAETPPCFPLNCGV